MSGMRNESMGLDRVSNPGPLTWKNKQEKAGCSQSHDTTKCRHQPAYQIWLSSLHGCGEIFDEKVHYSKYGKKEYWTNTGKNKQRRLVLNPTIQHIVINLHTKWDYSSLHGSGEIFDEKFQYSKYGKKEYWTNTSRKRLVLNPTIQHIVIKCIPNMSSLNGCEEIFDTISLNKGDNLNKLDIPFLVLLFSLDNKFVNYTKIVYKNLWKGLTLKRRKGEQPLLYATHR